MGGPDSHKDKVGQNVQYAAHYLRRIGVTGSFKVMQQLPPVGGDWQYRIKNAKELHEGIAKESQLSHAT
jgi:hypothetical protein